MRWRAGPCAAAAYLVCDLPVVVLAFIAAMVAISGSAALITAPLFIPLVGVFLRVLAGTERRLQRTFLGTDFPEPVYATDFPSTERFAVRVVIADDSLLLREGLALLLDDAGHEVVAAVADGPAFVAAMAEHRPDLGIVDVCMPPSHTDEGLRAAVEVRAADPEAKVLVLSQYVVLAYADDLLADGRGGVGYLLKDRVARMDQFLGAVEQVAAGGTSLDPEAVTQLFGRRRAAQDPVAG